MQEFDYKGEQERENGDKAFSMPVRAGRRTYFFDIRVTRNDDYYLTITESVKRHGSEGNSFFDKYKLFVHREDLVKFAEGLGCVIDYVKKQKPDLFEKEQYEIKDSIESISASATDIEFESL